MTDPILRVKCSSGDTWDDPSEDLLFELIADIERGDEYFFVVNRVGAGAQTYAQVARNADGTWCLEHRAGDSDHHFTSVVPEMREMHAVLTKWAFGLPGWEAWDRWEKVDVSTWTAVDP